MHNPRIRPKKEVVESEKMNCCPECGCTQLNYDSSRAEISCKECGFVIDENIIDAGPEWNAYSQEQQNNRARTGSPASNLVHDGGLPSVIDKSNKNISSKNASQWYRLRKWNKKMRISGARERSLAFALNNLSRKSSNLNLPRDIRELASSIYRKAVDNHLIRGRTIEGVVSASIYIACRKYNLPRTLAEISEVSELSKKELGRVYRFIANKLNIKLAPTSPGDYIPRFASELNLSEKIQVKSLEIIGQSRKKGLVIGKGPNGFAAAALYIASQQLGERRTQKDIADVAGVTEVTLRNRYKEISENLNLSVAI